MKEFIDKLIERLEEEKKYCSYHPHTRDEAINKAIAIVNQLAEEHKDDIQTIDVSELLGESEQVKQTNADRLRAMSDKELVEFLLKVNTAYAEPCMTGEGVCKWEDYPTHDKGCKDCFMEWLQSEVEE